MNHELMGAILKSSQWSAGAILMFAQVPVIIASSGSSALLGVGILYADILSIPAVILYWLAGKWRQAHRGK